MVAENNDNNNIGNDNIIDDNKNNYRGPIGGKSNGKQW